MRLGRLLVLAILVLVAGRTAASQEIQNQSKNSGNNDYVQRLAPQKDFGIRSSSGETWTMPEDRANVCLTMHTIRVSRPHGTDPGHVIGESTCTPAVRFEMKAVDSNPPPQK